MAVWATPCATDLDDMTMADDVWIAAARERVAHGGTWERSWDEIVRSLRESKGAQGANESAFVCPACETHPPLISFPRHKRRRHGTMWYCDHCYGFWATDHPRDSAFSDDDVIHPALGAQPELRACRLCGTLSAQGSDCPKCGYQQPVLACPSCNLAMIRQLFDSATIDSCDGCGGVWFDGGEVRMLFHLDPASRVHMRRDHRPEHTKCHLCRALGVMSHLVNPLGEAETAGPL